MRYISLLYAISLGVPLFSSAQTVGSPGGAVQSGSRVRILSPVFGDKTQTATVISSSPESLVFRLNAESAPQTLSTASITRMDVSTGTRSHKLKGALIGLATGAVLGGIVGYATWQRPTCKNPNGGFGCIAIDFGPTGDAAFAAGATGILGTFAGMLIGARHTDTWAPVVVPQTTAAIER
jgi:hypothetical protein